MFPDLLRLSPTWRENTETFLGGILSVIPRSIISRNCSLLPPWCKHQTGPRNSGVIQMPANWPFVRPWPRRATAGKSMLFHSFQNGSPQPKKSLQWMRKNCSVLCIFSNVFYVSSKEILLTSSTKIKSCQISLQNHHSVDGKHGGWNFRDILR